MKWTALVLAAVSAACAEYRSASADELVIESFTAGGKLSFYETTNAASYRVAWSTNLHLVTNWSTSAPDGIAAIPPEGPGLRTVTVGVQRAACYFRVEALISNGVAATEYMVIDLAAGPTASSYPVSYLTAVPPGGWTDEHKTTKLVMRRIPAGTFTMGSPTDELGRYSNEAQRQVTLTKDFYIGVFEVTQKQWERVMGTWPSYFNNVTYRDSRPVEQVSYYDIRENPTNGAISPNWPQSPQVHGDSFMGTLRAKTGLATLDLPTESQWEYACRAGTGTALNSGKNLTNTGSCPNMSEVGRYWYNGGSSGFSQGCAPSAATTTAGSYLVNQWGLYDMHGNVWEWCLDWYETYHAPTTDPGGAASGARRSARGGSWDDLTGYCRSAHRGRLWPDGRGNSIGFRLSRTLP